MNHSGFRLPTLLPAAAALATAAVALTLAPLVSPRPDLSAQGFGNSIAVVNDHVLIGEASNATLPGIVYVYGLSGGGWIETGRLGVSEINDAPDGFGRSLDGDGDLAIVGAPDLENGQGAVLVYRDQGQGEWSDPVWLTPATRVEDARFGAAVAISGQVALISAPGEDDGAGAVYTFTWDGTTWHQRTRAVSPENGQGFGATLALDGTVALVASAQARETTADVFAARVDPASGQLGAWSALSPDSDLGERSLFGLAVAVRGSLALVGAPGTDEMAGKVFLFERDDAMGTWTPAGALSAFDAAPRSQFGSAIGFDDGDVRIGAPGANGGMGGLYHFTRGGEGGWTSVVRSGRDDLGERASFGSAVALAGDISVTGAGGIDGRAGGAVIAERGAGAEWGSGDLVIGDHRGLPAIVGLDDEIPCVENAAAGYECDNVNIISFLPIKEMAGARGARLNDIWGWTDPESGREIAIVGRTDGTAFVDLTDPYNPVVLGDLPKTPGSRSSVWRDMKVYRDHAYIVADGAGEHGVQVFDLRRLREVRGEPVTFEPDYTYPGIHSAHNIVVNEDTGFGYAVGSSGGGETCGGGLHMLDLSEPGMPEFAGCFFDGQTGRRGTGYSHDAQCVIYHGPDEDYTGREICLGSNETALSISDVTDKANPVVISMPSYPAVAYAHQGWLTEDHRYFYMNDEGDEPQGLVEGTRTLVWDVVDLDEPILVKEYIASTPDTDHNLYIRGNLMYQSNYGAGLRILDITNPTDPVEIAFFDNSPYGGASWSNYPYFESGVVVMTSTGDGLFIVRNTARRNLIP